MCGQATERGIGLVRSASVTKEAAVEDIGKFVGCRPVQFRLGPTDTFQADSIRGPVQGPAQDSAKGRNVGPGCRRRGIYRQILNNN